LDERWSNDAQELAAGLRHVLEHESSLERVRQAELDGRDDRLDQAMLEFGLWELPVSPELLAAAALETGRALAAVPFVEATPARVVLGLPNVAYGLEGPVPACLPEAVVLHEGAVHLSSVAGTRRRTAAGDVLVELASPPGPAVGDACSGDRMRRLIRLLDAARTVGAARALLDLGVQYAKDRQQFGRPIGAFQAISHRLVDVAIAVDGAELLVRKAAYVAEPMHGGDGAPDALLAVMCRAKAVEAGRLAASVVHQVLGGFGFTTESDCQLFSRRIRSWGVRLGHPQRELADVARAVLDAEQRERVRHVWHFDAGMPLPRWAAEVDAPPKTGLSAGLESAG
jgi:hypothetical protein